MKDVWYFGQFRGGRRRLVFLSGFSKRPKELAKESYEENQNVDHVKEAVVEKCSKALLTLQFVAWNLGYV